MVRCKIILQINKENSTQTQNAIKLDIGSVLLGLEHYIYGK